MAAAGCAVVVALAGCTHGTGHSRAAVAESSGVTSSAGLPPVGSATTRPPASPAPLAGASTVGRAGNPSSGKGPAARTSARPSTPVLNPPGDSGLSGVICDYVSRSDVEAILSGTSSGQENDLSSVAVSYCAFHNSTGTVTVGVKNLDAAATAAAQVRAKYDEMSGEPDESVLTFRAAGGFAFQIGYATPLKSGTDLYAVNAQGSRGSWYVTIQYYAHTPCSSSAMEHLLATVLAKVP